MRKTLTIISILLLILITISLLYKPPIKENTKTNFYALTNEHVEAFLTLISMGYLKISDRETVFVHEYIWNDLSNYEKINFCINLSLYMESTLKSGTSGFYIYDIITGIKLGRYTREWGYQEFNPKEKDNFGEKL